MVVRFNMIDGSELYLKNVISIEDVGRDLRITFDFKAYEPGKIVDMYLPKVANLHKDHFMNCVASYETQERENWCETSERDCTLVDYSLWEYIDHNKSLVISRNGQELKVTEVNYK